LIEEILEKPESSSSLEKEFGRAIIVIIFPQTLNHPVDIHSNSTTSFS
jgi:hypothetical protein